MRKPLRELLVRRVLPPVALQLYRGAGASWRYVSHHEDILRNAVFGPRPVVGAFLHARTFQLLRYFSRPERGRWALMCSQSRDGDAIAYVEQRLGFQVVRGSSGRGGARALVSLIKQLRDSPGLCAGLSIDGSRGPRGIAQAGGLVLAQKSGGVVLPIAASTRQCWVYSRSWDRLALPRPFAEIHVDVAEPIAVPADADAVAIERLRLQLEETVLALHADLDRHTGFADTEPLRAPDPAADITETRP
jgi:lysophospholipid acyltransferase (LPLAT)-like uncharacterized protein